MQTFLPFPNPTQTARVLDDKRLGKQRVEALQIADCLLQNKASHWKHHPAVLMWSGYESYLVKVYISAIIHEWQNVRMFRNEKCQM